LLLELAKQDSASIANDDDLNAVVGQRPDRLDDDAVPGEDGCETAETAGLVLVRRRDRFGLINRIPGMGFLTTSFAGTRRTALRTARRAGLDNPATNRPVRAQRTSSGPRRRSMSARRMNRRGQVGHRWSPRSLACGG